MHVDGWLSFVKDALEVPYEALCLGCEKRLGVLATSGQCCVETAFCLSGGCLIKLYIKLGKCTVATIGQLGYPTKKALKS